MGRETAIAGILGAWKWGKSLLLSSTFRGMMDSKLGNAPWKYVEEIDIWIVGFDFFEAVHC
jgi:hypothetical protein